MIIITRYRRSFLDQKIMLNMCQFDENLNWIVFKFVVLATQYFIKKSRSNLQFKSYQKHLWSNCKYSMYTGFKTNKVYHWTVD